MPFVSKAAPTGVLENLMQIDEEITRSAKSRVSSEGYSEGAQQPSDYEALRTLSVLQVGCHALILSRCKEAYSTERPWRKTRIHETSPSLSEGL